MKQGMGLGWVAMGIGAVALVSGILSIPVWQQNRYLGIMKTQVELQKEVVALNAEITDANMENGHLKSLSRIEPVAKAIGLGFYALPKKIMEIPVVVEGEP